MPETPTPTASTVGDPPPRPSHRPALALWLSAVVAAVVAFGIAFAWTSGRVELRSPLADADIAPTTGDSSVGPSVEGAGTSQFRLASLDGGMVGPADYPGDVVVIDFWATWCGPCRQQAKILEELHTELDGEGVRFLAVDVGEDEDTVRRFAQANPFPYPVLLDPDDQVASALGARGFPTVVVLAPDGSVAFRNVGVVDGNTLKRAIDDARTSA